MRPASKPVCGSQRPFASTHVLIQLNGSPYEAPAALTVAELLQQLEMVRHVAVEVNEEVVPRALHAETPLRSGDRVELVTLVGGG